LHDAIKACFVYDTKETLMHIKKCVNKDWNWLDFKEVKIAEQEAFGKKKVDVFLYIEAKAREKAKRYSEVQKFLVYVEIKTGGFNEKWVEQIKYEMDWYNRSLIKRQRGLKFTGHSIFCLVAYKTELEKFTKYVREKQYGGILKLVSKVPLECLIPLAKQKQLEWINKL